MEKTYKILTYGCQMNVHESEKIAGLLEREGYTCTENDFADVVVLNTCCVRESAETRILGNLGILKKTKEQHPEMKIIVCGCMTQADGAAERLQKRCPFLYAILGTHNLDKIPEILSENERHTHIEVSQTYAVKEDIPIARTSGINAWVNIMYGCNNFCTYCIVPYVRGRERSREKKRVIADVKALVEQGYKQITLLGQNVNSYGHDLIDKNSDFASLLRDLSEVDGKFRIKFMTSHPKDIQRETILALSSGEKLSHFLHVPAQAGSDRILKLMNRGYTAREYLNKVDMIRTIIPDAGLSGDIMVGFPTETEEDFADTLRLVQNARYDNLYTFIYSRRNGTPAAAMEGQVPISDKKHRIRELIATQAIVAEKQAAQAVGKQFEVLCSEYRDGKLIGETACGKAVVFDGKADLVGKFFPVRIIKHKNSKLYGVIQ